MTDRLRELLVVAADDAPHVTPADGTWRRARRARLRDLVMVPVAVVVLLVLVGVSVVSLGSTSYGGFEPADDEPAPALPERLYAVPSWAEPTTDSLDVGPLSIVWSQETVDGVIGVSATTGEYVLFELPDLDQEDSFMMQPRGFVLSPDGTRLAYTWLDVDDGGQLVDGGVAIVDLRSGQVDRHPVEFPEAGGGGNLHALPSDLSWSGDGRWLTFRVDGGQFPLRQRTKAQFVAAGPWIALEASSGREVTWDGNWVEEALTPAEDGRSLLVAEERAIVRVAPGGDRETVATFARDISATDLVSTAHGIVFAAKGRLYRVDPDGEGAQPLAGRGVYGARTILAAGPESVATIGSLSVAMFETTPLVADAEPTGRRFRLFGEGDPAYLRNISVAAIAVDAEPRPTSEPDWGMSPRTEKLLWLGGGGLLVLGGGVFLVLRLRRRWR